MKRYNITVNGTAYDVTVEETDGSAHLLLHPQQLPLPRRQQLPLLPQAHRRR